MGSDCTNCSKCDIGIISESQNEIDRQSIEYRNGNINRDQLILNNKDNIIKYYNNYLPQIIFLQIRLKKFLNKLKQSTDPKEDFYNKYYGTIELSQENLEIIGANNELADISNKEQLYHKIQNSKDKFKTLSQKYSSAQKNSNELQEEKKTNKVKDYKINNNAKYTGDMLNGKQEGYGIQIWEDGAKYEGEWKNGKTNGYGIFYHPDGDIYKGYWKDNEHNGFGIYVYVNNKKSYNGYFVNNVFEGDGHYIKKDGTEYMGSFNKGKKNGLGKYLFEDGRSYTGFWENGKQNGLGLYINEKNEEKYGVWINGKRNRWLQEDEVNTLKNENDNFYEQIINFDNEKYMFRKEKTQLGNFKSKK